MKIEILDDDLSRRVYDVEKFENSEEDIVYIDSSDKENSAVEILKAYKNGVKQVLFDASNQSIQELLKEVDFKDVDFSMLLFSSGTTGKPVGAFKTKENLEIEVKGFMKIIEQYQPKKVIATVPFVHVYGILTAIILPYLSGIDLFFKKHFLPHDLLESIEPNSFVVTTPLYIKSLLRLGETKDLSDVLFASSTAPLDEKSAKEFIEKFNTNLIQLFGSTETGGIAYKEQNDTLWKALPNVKVSTNEKSLLKINSPFISELLYEDGFKNTNKEVQSFDYVEFEGERFKIIGRDSQIFKVAGKRFSTLHVEEILESMSSVKKAFVVVKYNEGELKDETLEIYLESVKAISLKEINKILREKIGNIKFPIKLKVVEKIPTTAVGKKIIPL
ncbi:AMP-binding protein [Sulfurospirillum arcachonense]|uniref:AMP-binding protein n=1 Tax=Sulfurospirillum arcachonense TaxID=57666 RepID=UPI000469C10B|nr:AMP-binding protein [Sulfurospirillum arcachonense]